MSVTSYLIILGLLSSIRAVPVSVRAIVPPPRGAQVHKRALIIGVDGLDGAEMYNSDTPALNTLQSGGLWSRNARTHWTGGTISGPGWTSVLTGVEVVDHNITGNGGYEFRNRDYPTLMYKLKQAGYQTAASIQWTDIFDILEEDCCDASNRGSQQEVTDWVVERLKKETDPDDVIFVHLDDVDHAGHSHGFNAKNIHYVDAIEAADHNILEMINAVLTGPNVANEEWLIIVSADHGGDVGGSHGGITADYRQIPLVISGPTEEKGIIPEGFGNHMDIHPTTLDFFGLDPYPEGMDGRSWLHPIKGMHSIPIIGKLKDVFNDNIVK